jgi:pantetheine-phosphate adenylyltransferase
MRAAIYAGTFDPITFGHYDLIERGSELFDNLVVAVAVSEEKHPLFTLEERVALIAEVVKPLDNVAIDSFSGLLVEYARRKGIRVLLRGLRAYSDFEYEFMMALTNRKLAPEIETLFMMPKEVHSYVSSSTVRDVASFGGDTSEFVPIPVQKALAAKALLNPGSDLRPARPAPGRALE